MKYLIALLFTPWLLFAQADTSYMQYETDEVVVTATRMNQKTIDVPFPVYNINLHELRLDRKVSVSDVLYNVPGVFMQSRYGNHDVRISIRGYGSRSNSGIRGVRILLDGIPESEPDGQTRIEAIDFNALGNIEVVKGNSSSLYTNAPGGVINFINNFYYPGSFLVQYNDIGSFGLRRNGVQFGLKGESYNLLSTYTYHGNTGFREHSEDYWHVLNTVFQTFPDVRTRLEILGYLVNGSIRLPGSLTREQFESNPFQAAVRERDNDYRRVTKKGRVGIRFSRLIDDQSEIELTGYGTIKYFERTQRDFRIINRYGTGATGKYLRNYSLFSMDNSISLGMDVFYQTGPVENYLNISGLRSDSLQSLRDETIANVGIFLSNNTEFTERLSMLLTARLDRVIFDIRNQLLQSQNTLRRFQDITPKAALNYKFTETFAVYGSYGLSFDSPAGNELDDYPRPYDPNYNLQLLNPDLDPQKSVNIEAGTKGYFIREQNGFINDLFVDLSVFHLNIKNEIVPFEVLGQYFFRNAAQTIRQGVELGVNLRLLKRLTWNTAYTYNDFAYSDYSALAISSVGGDITSTYRDYSGNIVPNVPVYLINNELLYSYLLLDNLSMFIKANHSYAGSMYVDDANSERTRSYSIINSALGLEFSFKRFNILVTGSLNNITDEVYAGFININSSNKSFYEAGEPRSFYSRLRIKYEF
jgi:iron complex outermembrane recepter protein